MRRGEVWTVAGGGDDAGKPRPCVIVQDDAFDATPSVTVCPFTTAPTGVDLVRPVIEPSSTNGVTRLSRVMVDKVATVPKTKLGIRIGQLDGPDMIQIDRALIVFLGLANTGLRR